MDTHWFKIQKKDMRRLAGRAVRTSFALALLVLTFGPLPYAPLGGSTPAAQADNLEWDYVRPVLSDEADTTEADGFDLLPRFGNVPHAIAVAPNGDIFAAGNPGDVDRTGDGDCDDAADVDLDGDDACDSSAPIIYKSTDGGMKWRAADSDIPAGAVVTGIAVSPNYPGDDFIIAVFSNLDSDGGDTTDGIATSTNAGLDFDVVVAGGDWADGDMDFVEWLTVALTPDFDSDDGGADAVGAIAIGGAIYGAGTGSVFRIAADDFNDDPTGTTVPWAQMTHAGAAEAAFDKTLHLAYSGDEEDPNLARLFVDDSAGNTWGQILSGTDFPNDDNGTIIHAGEATAGQVAFDATYDEGGNWYAATSIGGAAGGVFKFTAGAWDDLTAGEDACDTGFSSLFVSGDGSSAKLTAAEDQGVVVCRSTNAGSSWNDSDADGDPDLADLGISGGDTRIAGNTATPSTVYWTTSGNLGAVAKSTNSGSSWADTGLTNQAYTVITKGVNLVSNTSGFASVSDPITGEDALFWTDNYGTSAGWVRVLRYEGTDLTFAAPSRDFLEAGTVYATTTNTVLKGTNMGRTWEETGEPEPFSEIDEDIATEAQRSASTFWVGGAEGHIAVTTDGGATWTVMSKDFGDAIDEFDFASDTVFFVTAYDGNTFKIWRTADGGATFTQVGDSPWGTGEGGINTRLVSYDGATNTGYVTVMTEDAVSTNETYRLHLPEGTAFEDLDLDVEWEDWGHTGATGIGDGVLFWFWADGDNGPDDPRLRATFNLLTGDPEDMMDGSDNDLFLTWPVPDIIGGMVPTRNAGGYTLQVIAGGQINEMTVPGTFLSKIATTSPPANAQVATNVGDEGIPVSFTWNDVPDADVYDLMVGEDPDLDDGDIIATPDNNRATIDAGDFAFVIGRTYYWRVRVAEAEGEVFEGPWSDIKSFTVSTTSPTMNQPSPNLPLNGSQLPGLSTTLSWNNPPGVTQVQVQVTPLNGDGPAINLIIGSAINQYVVPAPVFGTGPYVMLPGAMYTWRVRVTSSTDPNISENSPSWGPWSDPRTFTTRRPDSGTLQLVSPINGASVSDTTPTVTWKNSAADEFYYEVQLSADPNFNTDPRSATAAVFWNLLHGGQSSPPNSWTVPDANALSSGTYYWRIRQRLQATAAGSAEVGIAWSPAQRFVIP